MAKIIDPDSLNVGTEITIDTTAKTFTLVEAGNLVAKDGVTLQALYSKFYDLWLTDTYNKFPFPMYVIDAKSGQFQFGTDGQTFNGWKPANDTTRQMLRDGGWSEYSAAGVLNRQYVGIVSLGEESAGTQNYYQRELGGTAYDFTFEDEVNEGIQVYGDATNGNFDTRSYFKAYCREYGKKYTDSVLADTGQVATGAYTVNMLLSNEDDLKIQDNDATVASAAPYTGMSITYYAVNQDCAIGGSNYPFKKIMACNGGTAEEIYTKAQWMLRQNSDIDAGAGTVIGKTADTIMWFVGDTLYTTAYLTGYDPNDINRIVFIDANGVERTEPYTAAGTLTFNSYLTAGGTGTFSMYFTDLPGGNDWGTANAIKVDDADGADITGTITGASIPFTFAYDSNVQGGRTAGTDAAVTVVASNPNSAKTTITTYTITRTVGQNISLVAEQDRSYLV